MSTEQSLDPSLIEQTKQQIRTLVNEIAQLAKSDLSPEEFHGEFLPRVVSALAAIGGAVWTVEDQGRLTLQYQINLQETKLRDSEEAQVRHGRLLQKVLTSGEEILVPPQSGAGDDTEAGNPTDFLLVLGPLKTELEVVGVIEVFQRPDAGPTTQKGYLRFLKQMCDLAGDFFKSRQLRHFGDRQILWTQLEEFTRGIHVNLDPRDTAYTIANEGRRLIECDRVSVAIRRGNKCRIEAVSGQDLFDKRSNTVRLLGKLASAVVASGETVWYTGDTTNMAPQVEDAVQEYVDESHSKTVAVIPLSRPQPELEEEDDPDKREAPAPPFAALIVEQIEDSRVPQKTVQRVEVVAQHSCTALANALEHNSLFLMPVWRKIGQMRWIVKARTLPKTVMVFVAVLLLFALLLFPGTWPFKAHCDGTIEPVLHRDVFAEIDGDVQQVHVEHKATVSVGDPMVTLESVDLNIQLEDILGKLREVNERLAANDRLQNLASRGSSNEDEARLMQLGGDYSEAKVEQGSLLLQLELCKKKMEQLEIRAPIAGKVVTWKPENLLTGRPVQRGQALMRINDPEGPWQIELMMPEKRMGHIERMRAEIKAENPDDDLKVEYVLANDPDKTLVGTVTEIHYQAEVRGDEGNTVLMKVAIDKEELLQSVGQEGDPDAIRPGAGVSAKVACGNRSVGYVLFCDAIAYFQKNIAFRFF